MNYRKYCVVVLPVQADLSISSPFAGLIWTYVGSHDNPQARVLASRLEFGTTDLRYSLSSPGYQRQSFAIKTSANFIQIAKGLDTGVAPSPPVAISVPYDVWYPFQIDSFAMCTRSYGANLIMVVMLFTVFQCPCC